MMKLKKWTAIAVAVAVLMMLLPTAAFAAVEGFEVNNCLVIATEPGGTSEHVTYYKSGEEQPLESMVWVDGGVRGKALVLDGATDHLELGYYQLRMAQMTFSTWINFRGSVNDANPAGAYWQRLFTIESGTDCYFTVSPHAVDATVTNAEGQLNGVYMEYFRGDDTDNYSMKSFSGASNKSHFGLPQDEWHHIAVVVDSMSVKLYVDANLILEEVFLMPIVQMSADTMFIGGGLWNDPMLNALVDDMLLFDRALSAQEIAALMQTGDTNKLLNPAAATTTQTAYLPTTAATTTTVTEPTEVPADKPYAPFGLPVWGFGVCVGLLALFVVLTVVVNLYELNRRKAKRAADTDEEPELSIKEAALQKRREEQERFLTEEERENEGSMDETKIMKPVRDVKPSEDTDEGGESE